MYTPVEPPIGASFNRLVLQATTAVLSKRGFELESLSESLVTYRRDEEYLNFALCDGNLCVCLGVGHPEHDEGINIRSMRLDDLVRFQYGSLHRGVHPVATLGLAACLEHSLADLQEFAPDFLVGDFRAFLRTVGLKHREDRGMLRESSTFGHKHHPSA